MNGLRLIYKRVVALVLTILLLAVPIVEPLFYREVKGAEIGMVGALPGSVTLWEIFQTIFAGAGIIVANDNIQSAASLNLGSSSYTLEELENLGFIRIGTDGSSALDWDWSGLEDTLRDDEESEDTKIIKGVFEQNGGVGSGGNNTDPDEDPWYKKAVNWVKNAVTEGKIKLTNEISNGSESITYSLTAIAGMLGAAFNKNVYFGVSASESLQNVPVSGNMNVTYRGYTGITNGVQLAQTFTFSNVNENQFRFYYYTSKGTNSQTFSGYFGNRTQYSVRVYETFYNLVTGALEQSNYLINTGVVQSSSSTANISASNNYDINVLVNGYGEQCANRNECFEKATEFVNAVEPEELPRKNSPDIITPDGNAVSENPVNGQGGAWVPTPYMEPGTELEILPQPKINEFTQYVIQEMPEPGAAGEAWIDTVDPYKVTEPTPVPTKRPQPTQKPDVTKIPEGEPGGEDNPIYVNNPDPMPVIEGGFATTYGLMDYFPFCIPSDIVSIYKLFETDEDARAAPYIDWNIKIDRFGIDEHIVLDFSVFDSSAEVCRILMFITFCFGLLLATKQIIWS